MNKKTRNYSPFVKKMYKISKERLETYLITLDDTSKMIGKMHTENDKWEVDPETLHMIWEKIINVWNSMYGFKNYEDAEAGGEVIQDLWINWSSFDENNFFSIEFPNGIDTKENQPPTNTNK